MVFIFMAKIDYEYKSTILKTDLCKELSILDRDTYLYQRYGYDKNGVLLDKQELDNKSFDLLLEYGNKAIEEGRKINKASHYRKERLQERVSSMLECGTCIFCTFNFSDEVLASTSADTRRRYVARFLKQFNCRYVANIDFGSNKVYKDRKGNERQATSREHYHALICIDKLPPNAWPYGWQWLERVDQKRYRNSEKKLSKYIAKLSNHAIKETTKRSVLIYSR